MELGPFAVLVLLPALALGCLEEQISVTKHMDMMSTLAGKGCHTPEFCVNKTTQAEKGCIELKCHYTKDVKNPNKPACKCECICSKACPAGLACNPADNRCESICPQSAIQNSNVENKTFFVGETANVTCHETYALVGPEDVECYKNKTMSEEPTCKRLCPSPPETIKNGIIVQQNKTEYFANDRLLKRCDNNSILASHFDYIACKPDGTWTTDVLGCKSVPAHSTGNGGATTMAMGISPIRMWCLFTLLFFLESMYHKETII